MEILIPYAKAFLVGGAICALAQLLVDRTKLTPARIMTLLVVSGVALGAIGVYGPLADWAGAGATTPITGFGWALAKGVKKAVEEKGWLGVFTGPLTAASGGIGAAILFSLAAALIFRSKEK
ncbi:MAG: stage V sporulation protein AE [bacterium]